MGGDPIPGLLDALREWFETRSHVQSCGALSAEARAALPLDGGVKCYGGSRSVPGRAKALGETGL